MNARALIPLAGVFLFAWMFWQMKSGPVPDIPHFIGAKPAAQSVAKAADPLRAAYDPIHFRPAIETARDEQCLACHREVLDDRVRTVSPAGLKASEAKAWYQQLSTYTGAQDTFHRRHLVSDFAKKVMNLRCNTCHQGHDPRDENPGSSATAQQGGYALRKQVDLQTCLMCHGKMDFALMGLPSDWHSSRDMFGDSCLTCHTAIRTERHRVNFLDAAAIEEAGKEGSDACYGCHGGRAWYRIPYAYARHDWPGMPEETPDWAKHRAKQSATRFLGK